ncbi:retrotransposon protein [Cucumis melo var. makuwa]|uniref:Retrotransposon protein n=2 Tax=Cucumis melo TaxID=3656 RepID=A0A5A7USV9_CUCMM|nr:retrotransposon protein [Cucumis melo var. makuwa]TYK24273.1 retrotransposon protein [Cucumis melo var. makuwa]
MANSTRAPKHPWTEEKCTLVECLVDLVNARGWRLDDRTFRPRLRFSCTSIHHFLPQHKRNPSLSIRCRLHLLHSTPPQRCHRQVSATVCRLHIVASVASSPMEALPRSSITDHRKPPRLLHHQSSAVVRVSSVLLSFAFYQLSPISHVLTPIVLVFLSSSLKTSFVLGVPLGSPKIRDVPTRSEIVRVLEHVSLGVPFYRTLIGRVEVRAEGSWRMTRSDRGMPYRNILLPPLYPSCSEGPPQQAFPLLLRIVIYIIGKDCATGAHAETFANVRSNVSSGPGSSGSKRKWGAPNVETMEVIRDAMECANDQLRAIADWSKLAMQDEDTTRWKVIRQLQAIPELSRLDRARCMQTMAGKLDEMKAFLNLLEDMKMD